MSDYIRDCTSSQVVKSYTKVMMVCEPELATLMAQVPVVSDDLDTIASAIHDWCLVGGKALEYTVYPSSLAECLEDCLTTTDVYDTDTVGDIIKAFYNAIKWNTVVK